MVSVANTFRMRQLSGWPMPSVWLTVRTGPLWLEWASVHKSLRRSLPPLTTNPLCAERRTCSARRLDICSESPLPQHELSSPDHCCLCIRLEHLQVCCPTLCTLRPHRPPAPYVHLRYYVRRTTCPSPPCSSSGTTSPVSITTPTPWRRSPCSCSRARRPTTRPRWAPLSTPCTPSRAP